MGLFAQLDESGALIRSLLQTPADEESLRQLSLAQQSSKLTLMKRLVNSVLLRKSQIQDAVIETVVRVLIVSAPTAEEAGGGGFS